ncbi:hypothetical protein [Novosphingobium sp. FSW06-99]|uniref:hypothetical protein n=1 Tax=Novosphingobium sp. FSW06-99 TaxID=1739113 RepID=UPI00076C03A8|nr:hypothetical protein [Novosphingobium sp. FSW06-99]KUR74305.1 hypothetical protein AQZ49_18530 [Novosphingobium sp. FSW06-99]
MPLRKYRYLPESPDDPRAVPRLAVEHDGFVVSPVHAMHENLWVFAEDQPLAAAPLYPGWFRLAFPLVASGGLWVIIFWALGYFH